MPKFVLRDTGARRLDRLLTRQDRRRQQGWGALVLQRWVGVGVGVPSMAASMYIVGRMLAQTCVRTSRRHFRPSDDGSCVSCARGARVLQARVQSVALCVRLVPP